MATVNTVLSQVREIYKSTVSAAGVPILKPEYEAQPAETREWIDNIESAYQAMWRDSSAIKEAMKLPMALRVLRGNPMKIDKLEQKMVELRELLLRRDATLINRINNGTAARWPDNHARRDWVRDLSRMWGGVSEYDFSRGMGAYPPKKWARPVAEWLAQHIDFDPSRPGQIQAGMANDVAVALYAHSWLRRDVMEDAETSVWVDLKMRGGYGFTRWSHIAAVSSRVDSLIPADDFFPDVPPDRARLRRLSLEQYGSKVFHTCATQASLRAPGPQQNALPEGVKVVEVLVVSPGERWPQNDQDWRPKFDEALSPRCTFCGVGFQEWSPLVAMDEDDVPNSLAHLHCCGLGWNLPGAL